MSDVFMMSMSEGDKKEKLPKIGAEWTRMDSSSVGFDTCSMARRRRIAKMSFVSHISGTRIFYEDSDMCWLKMCSGRDSTGPGDETGPRKAVADAGEADTKSTPFDADRRSTGTGAGADGARVREGERMADRQTVSTFQLVSDTARSAFETRQPTKAVRPDERRVIGEATLKGVPVEKAFRTASPLMWVAGVRGSAEDE